MIANTKNIRPGMKHFHVKAHRDDYSSPWVHEVNLVYTILAVKTELDAAGHVKEIRACVRYHSGRIGYRKWKYGERCKLNHEKTTADSLKAALDRSSFADHDARIRYLSQ